MATKSDFIVKSGIRVAANATISGSLSVNTANFTGNVGIGTSTPAFPLDVSGNIRATNYVYGDAAVISPLLTYNGAGDLTVTHGGNYSIKFVTNGSSEKMRVAANGNVGIGTTSPSTKLEVVGKTRLNFGNLGTDFLSLYNGVGNESIIRAVAVNSTYNGLYLVNNANGVVSQANTALPSWFVDIGGTAADGTSFKSAVADSFRVGRIAGGGSFFNTDALLAITSAGNVGIGATAPAYPLQVRRPGGAGSLGITVDNVFGPSDRSVKYLSVGDSGTDTSGHAFYTRNGSTTDIGALYISPIGSVGIGTTSTPTKLHVQGTSLFRSTGAAVTLDSASATDARMEFLYNGTRSGYISVDNSTLSLTANSAAALILGANAQEYMRISSLGFVGIGSTNPQSKLHIQGTNETTSSQLQLTGTGVLSGYIGPSSNGLELGVDNANILFRTGVTGNLSVTTGAERMRITSAGNVGIGTSSPSYKLDIAGTVRVKNGTVGYILGPSGELLVGEDSGGYYFAQGFGVNPTSPISYGSNGTTYQRWFANGSERMRLTSAGNVGIGTTGPLTRLDINDGYVRFADGWGLIWGAVANPPYISGNNTDDTLTFGNAGSERMRIDSAGNVGVGTTTPSSFGKFAVNSTTNVYGFKNSPSNTISHIGGNGTYGVINADLFIQTPTNTGSAGTIQCGPTLQFGVVYGTNPATPVLNNGNIIFSGWDGTNFIRSASITSQVENTFTTNAGYGNLLFATNNGSAGPTERMRITSAGNVGIGTSSPSENLEVNANIKAKQIYNNYQILTDGATITFNANLGAVAEITLTGTNRTITPSNLKAGALYHIIVKQDGTGNRTIGKWNNFYWENGVVPTLSTEPNAVNVVSGISDGIVIYADFKVMKEVSLSMDFINNVYETVV